MTTAMLSQRTERLKFMIAFRPGLVSPTLAAQMAATFQRHSGGRLLLNVVTGGDGEEQRALGDRLDKDARYERTAEFLSIVRQLWRGEQVDLDGQQLSVSGAQLEQPPQTPPPIYLGGSSPAALDVAARHVDVYLSWGEPPSLLGGKLKAVEAIALRARDADCDSGSACTWCLATAPRRRGARPSACSTASPRRPSSRSRRGCAAASRRASGG